MAGMVIACLPIIVLFIVMQKSFIRGHHGGKRERIRSSYRMRLIAVETM